MRSVDCTVHMNTHAHIHPLAHTKTYGKVTSYKQFIMFIKS